jgi:hypothetical protein
VRQLDLNLDGCPRAVGVCVVETDDGLGREAYLKPSRTAQA